MLIEHDGLKGFWKEAEKPMPGNSLGFDNQFLEFGEEDMEKNTTKEKDESRPGEERFMTNELGKEI
jgi:hypothetical protein